MTLSEFIEALQSIEKEHGKKEVALSADAEGNYFHKVDAPVGIEMTKKAIIIYPSSKSIQL